MSDELKACPFCGGVAQVNTWTMHGITESRCFCSNSDCPNSVRTVAFEQWNTRPIEDVLIAERDQAREMVDWLIAIGDLLLNQGGASEKVLLAEDEWRKLVDAWKAAR